MTSGNTPYNPETYSKAKKRSYKILADEIPSLKPSPTNIFKSVFEKDLNRLGVEMTVTRASCSNLGISLMAGLRQKPSAVDYVVLLRATDSQFFNGASPHFDTNLHGNELRFSLMAYVASKGPSQYACYCRYGDQVYEIHNTMITLITEKAFIEVARGAELFIFKLVTPLKNAASVSSHEKNRPPAPSREKCDDPFEFEPLSKKRKLVNNSSKRKITVEHMNNQVQNHWVTFSETGRLDMYTEQYKLCQSVTGWYDDIIINSYAQMCCKHRSNSFFYQDTCLATVYHPGKLLSVDQKFIQILNPFNTHWFCVSNAQTFINEGHIVEIYDSLKCAQSLRSVDTINSTISEIILQLRPNTTEIRYIACQKQMNGYDCGPYALAFLWALSMGHHPLQYEHIRGPMIRSKVRQSFIENRFIPPCSGHPRGYKKQVLKSFVLNTRTKRFTAATLQQSD